MGLDMYLNGELSLLGYGEHVETRDGFKVDSITLELAYWRKHPDLHGYIVNTFADGVDECQRIPLGTDDVRKIIDAIEQDKLPNTSGFFFGNSARAGDPEFQSQQVRDVGRFYAVLRWLNDFDDSKEWDRRVYYQASW